LVEKPALHGLSDSVFEIEEMTMDGSSRLTVTSIALVGLTVATASNFSFGQQQTTNLEIDIPEVVAEVKVAYDRYNEAINSGNIAVMNGTFRDDPRIIRYGQAENLYGYKEIEAFRAAARPLDPPRTLSKTVITTYGRDFAVDSTLTHRANQPGKVGRQMQSWARFPDGWHVVAAHVSTIDEPN
jgi:hypothetical protein